MQNHRSQAYPRRHGSLYGREPSRLLRCRWDKLTCSETKCYGSYILPVVFVFGVLVIGISLIVVGQKQGWF